MRLRTHPEMTESLERESERERERMEVREMNREGM